MILHARYRHLIQVSPLKAKVAPGYDIHPDAETGALRLYDAANEIGYPIPSQWRQVERQFLLDPSGRSVGADERAAAIDEECLFANLPAIVIKRAFLGGELLAA